EFFGGGQIEGEFGYGRRTTLQVAISGPVAEYALHIGARLGVDDARHKQVQGQVPSSFEPARGRSRTRVVACCGQRQVAVEATQQRAEVIRAKLDVEGRREQRLLAVFHTEVSGGAARGGLDDLYQAVGRRRRTHGRVEGALLAHHRVHHAARQAVTRFALGNELCVWPRVDAIPHPLRLRGRCLHHEAFTDGTQAGTVA